jgi:hypothetical protein
MQRHELQPYLTRLHPGLRVKRYSNRGEHILHGGNDAVYFYTQFVGVVPVGNIYLRGNVLYRGSKYTNRSLQGLLNLLRGKGIIKPYKIREAHEAYRSF